MVLHGDSGMVRSASWEHCVFFQCTTGCPALLIIIIVPFLCNAGCKEVVKDVRNSVYFADVDKRKAGILREG